jgi:hypothetical protein
VGSFIASFSTDLAWDELVRWPADVFAVTNLVLDHTETYRVAVSPPAGGRWPPDKHWQDRVTAAAAAWRDTAGASRRGSDLAPSTVSALWRMLGENLDVPVEALRHGDVPELSEALLTLHAVADEAHRELATSRRAWACSSTVRSFSRYLALNYESIELHWHRVEVGEGNWVEGRRFHQVLLPWPLMIGAGAFAPVEGPLGMDEAAFGFFEYQPENPLDLDLVAELLETAQRSVDRINSLILPEAALSADEIGPLEALLAHAGVDALVAGARCPSTHGQLSRNYVHLGFRTPGGWIHHERTSTTARVSTQHRSANTTSRGCSHPRSVGGTRSSWRPAASR